MRRGVADLGVDGCVAPDLRKGLAVRHNLCRSCCGVLTADEAPAFPHRRIDPDVASEVNVQEFLAIQMMASFTQDQSAVNTEPGGLQA